MQLSGMASTVLRKRSTQRGVGNCPSATLSWGLWWLLCLKAPCSHRGEDQMTYLYCEGLKNHIMHKGSQVLHRSIRGWRYWLWETWWVGSLQAAPWSLSHLNYLCPRGPRSIWSSWDPLLVTASSWESSEWALQSSQGLWCWGLASEVPLRVVL